MAFHDINPQAPIHILVIPKKKGIRNIQEVDPATMGHIVKAIQEVAKELSIDKSGYRVITNNGEISESDRRALGFLRQKLGIDKLKAKKIELFVQKN